MSSNAERVPKVGAQARTEEATVNFLLEEIGRRTPSPTQAVKVCQILGLTSREEIKKVREVAKNKKRGESQAYSLNASEAKNKKQEESKEMEIEIRPGWNKSREKGKDFIIEILKEVFEDRPQFRWWYKHEVDKKRKEPREHHDQITVIEWDEERGFYGGIKATAIKIKPVGKFFCTPLFGFSDLEISVFESSKYLKYAQRIGELYKEKTGKNVTIFLEYQS